MNNFDITTGILIISGLIFGLIAYDDMSDGFNDVKSRQVLDENTGQYHTKYYEDYLWVVWINLCVWSFIFAAVCQLVWKNF